MLEWYDLILMTKKNNLLFSAFFLQDRVTFRRIILKNNAKKRKTFEIFIESVPLLKSLEVKSFVRGSP